MLVFAECKIYCLVQVLFERAASVVGSYPNQLVGVLQEHKSVSIIVYEQYAVLFGATIVHELEYNESVARIK